MGGKLELAYNDGVVMVYKNGEFVDEFYCEFGLSVALEALLLTRYNVGASDE